MKKAKKLLSLVTILAMLMMIMTGGLVFAGASMNLPGSGTEEDPYRISSTADFWHFAQEVASGNTFMGEHLAITSDIDLFAFGTIDNGIFFNNGHGWPAISGFAGTLDGRNHRIFNLFQDRQAVGGLPTGLFATLGTTGTIRNLGIVSGHIRGGQSAASVVQTLNGGTLQNVFSNVTVLAALPAGLDSLYGRAGGMVGQMSGGLIEDAWFGGTIRSNMILTGGMVGDMQGGTIRRSYVSGTVTTTGGFAIGGLVGQMMGPTVVEDSYLASTGIVVGGGLGFVGGIVGSNNGVAGRISRTANFGFVRGPAAVGGILGQNQQGAGGIVEYSFNAGTVVATGSGLMPGGGAGGIVGMHNSSATGLVANSYNLGDVVGVTGVGGIVGLVGGNAGANGATIRNSLNFGRVSTTANAGLRGGIVGANTHHAMIVMDSYFDTTVAAVPVGNVHRWGILGVDGSHGFPNITGVTTLDQDYNYAATEWFGGVAQAGSIGTGLPESPDTNVRGLTTAQLQVGAGNDIWGDDTYNEAFDPDVWTFAASAYPVLADSPLRLIVNAGNTSQFDVLKNGSIVGPGAVVAEDDVLEFVPRTGFMVDGVDIISGAVLENGDIVVDGTGNVVVEVATSIDAGYYYTVTFLNADGTPLDDGHGVDVVITVDASTSFVIPVGDRPGAPANTLGDDRDFADWRVVADDDFDHEDLLDAPVFAFGRISGDIYVAARFAYFFDVTVGAFIAGEGITSVTISTLGAPATTVNAAEVNRTQRFEEGTVITLTAAVAAGFRFYSWEEYDDGDDVILGTENVLVLTLSEDREITPNAWRVFVVTANNANGGGTHDMGAEVRLTPMALTGQTFVWWEIDGQAVSFDREYVIDELTGAYTITAVFVNNVVRVTLDTRGGVIVDGAPSFVDRTFGTAYGILPTASREGYTFGGWSRSATANIPVTPTLSVLGSDYTLFAIWTRNAIEPDPAPTEPPAPESSGCGSGSVAAGLLALSLVAGAGLFIKKRG